MAKLKTGSTVNGNEIATLAHLNGTSTVNGDLIATKLDVDVGKSKIKNAINNVDSDVVVPSDPTFQELADSVESIQTGKAFSSGVINQTIGAYTGSHTVSGLSFVPKFIICAYHIVGDSLYIYRRATAFRMDNPENSNYDWGHTDTQFGDVKVRDEPTDGSFLIDNQGADDVDTVYWYAFE